MRKFIQVIGLATAIVAAVGGVAFAILTSQLGIVRGNLIQTATASLQVSPNGNTFSNSMDGYVFDNLVPGGAAVPNSGYPIYIKNVGTTPLAVKISAGTTISNPDNVNLSKVHVIITPVGGGAIQNLTLQELMNPAGVTLNNAIRLLPSQIHQVTVQVLLEQDAVSGPSATLNNLDFNFGATATN